MIRDRATLKSFFETFDKPTESQFGDLIDSLLLAGDITNVPGNKPYKGNTGHTPPNTSGDNESTGITLIVKPVTDSRIDVFINGERVPIGDGVTTSYCYFSNDGGSTAKALNDLEIGDELYWNGTIAHLGDLESTDNVDICYDIATNLVVEAQGGGGAAEPHSKKYYISPIDGDDTNGDGSEALPYQTITKGETVAVAGDVLHMKPGDYTSDVSLGKDGVYYYFEMGARVIPSAPEGTIMWYLPTARTVYVGGYGEFVGGAIIRTEHADAKLFMQCLRMERVNGVSLSTYPCITAYNGYLNIHAMKDITSNNHHTLNWRFNCGGIISAGEFIKYKATASYQATCVNFANVSSTGLLVVRTPQIIAEIDGANPYINSAVGISVNTANILIDAAEITSNAPYYQVYNYGGAVTIGGTNTGNVTINGNINSTYSVGLLAFGSATTGNILVKGNITTTNNRAYVQSSNAVVTINGDIKGSGDSLGETISHGITGYFAYNGTGTTYINGKVISLYNDATGHPIKYYGGTIIFGTNAKLIATHASAEGINATAPITFQSAVLQSNKAINANATNLLGIAPIVNSSII